MQKNERRSSLAKRNRNISLTKDQASKTSLPSLFSDTPPERFPSPPQSIKEQPVFEDKSDWNPEENNTKKSSLLTEITGIQTYQVKKELTPRDVTRLSSSGSFGSVNDQRALRKMMQNAADSIATL